MPEGSGTKGKPSRGRAIGVAAPSRGLGDLASPVSEKSSASAPLSFKAWGLSPSSAECTEDIIEGEVNYISFDQDVEHKWMAALDDLRDLHPLIRGPDGLGHILKWMSQVETLLLNLWLNASGDLMTQGEAIARAKRQLRGLRHEHNARVRAARTHSSVLDQLSDTVRQLQQQLTSFATATVAVLEAESGGGASALAGQGPCAAPSKHSAAAAAAGNLAAAPGLSHAAATMSATAYGAAGAASRLHQPHQPAHTPLPPSPVAIAANKLLLRGVSSEQAAEMARGDFTALGLGEGPVGMYERRWRAGGTGRVWNVEVVVTKDQRAALIKGAARIKHTAGVTVAPFLTPEGRAARRVRQAQFDSLVERGLQPYWRGTDIVTEEGDRRRVHTMQ